MNLKLNIEYTARDFLRGLGINESSFSQHKSLYLNKLKEYFDYEYYQPRGKKRYVFKINKVLKELNNINELRRYYNAELLRLREVLMQEVENELDIKKICQVIYGNITAFNLEIIQEAVYNTFEVYDMEDFKEILGEDVNLDCAQYWREFYYDRNSFRVFKDISGEYKVICLGTIEDIKGEYYPLYKVMKDIESEIQSNVRIHQLSKTIDDLLAEFPYGTKGTLKSRVAGLVNKVYTNQEIEAGLQKHWERRPQDEGKWIDGKNNQVLSEELQEVLNNIGVDTFYDNYRKNKQEFMVKYRVIPVFGYKFVRRE